MRQLRSTFAPVWPCPTRTRSGAWRGQVESGLRPPRGFPAWTYGLTCSDSKWWGVPRFLRGPPANRVPLCRYKSRSSRRKEAGLPLHIFSLDREAGLHGGVERGASAHVIFFFGSLAFAAERALTSKRKGRPRRNRPLTVRPGTLVNTIAPNRSLRSQNCLQRPQPVPPLLPLIMPLLIRSYPYRSYALQTSSRPREDRSARYRPKRADRDAAWTRRSSRNRPHYPL